MVVEGCGDTVAERADCHVSAAKRAQPRDHVIDFGRRGTGEWPQLVHAQVLSIVS